jgi:hypothetical protein
MGEIWRRPEKHTKNPPWPENHTKIADPQNHTKNGGNGLKNTLANNLLAQEPDDDLDSSAASSSLSMSSLSNGYF